MGTPVVSTALGYEGLAVTPGVHLLRADTAEAFLSAIDRLTTSPELRQSLARRARELVEQQYDWSDVVDRLDEDYERLRKGSAGY